MDKVRLVNGTVVDVPRDCVLVYAIAQAFAARRAAHPEEAVEISQAWAADNPATGEELEAAAFEAFIAAQHEALGLTAAFLRNKAVAAAYVERRSSPAGQGESEAASRAFADAAVPPLEGEE